MMIADRYALETSLEQGRFGTVYRAIDRHRAAAGQDADVALWVLPSEFTAALPSLRHDLDRLRDLAHPNIVRVLDFGKDGEHFFVASELNDSETLRNVLDALGSERLAVAEADAVIESVGSALIHAHDLGIAHGDVRPENVIVTRDQDIKLANFALASLARDTPFAPALLDDTRALALLAHELYCGGPPDGGANAKALKQAPVRRRKAIEAAIAPRGVRSVTEFLEIAALSADTAPSRSPPAGRPDSPPRPRRSPLAPWWLALPVAGFAGFGIAWYADGGVDWERSVLALVDWLNDRNRDDVFEPKGVADAEPVAEAAPTTSAIAPAATPQSATALPAPAETATSAAREDRASPARSRPTAAAAAVRAETPGGVALSASSVTVRESQGVARVDLVRTGGTTGPLEVAWWTSDGTAHAGDDYAGFGARIETFAPGQTKRTLFVPLATDAVAEQPETFVVHVAPGSKAGVADGKLMAEIRIIDDDR